MNTFDRIQSLLEPLPRKFKARFALYCCDGIKDLISHPDSLAAIRLTKLWLEDKATAAEVDMAGDKAYEVANAYATNAASASSAVHAAYAAASASSSAYAASAYAATAHAASNAYAASHAYAASSYDSKMLQYEADLKNMIKDLTKLEKIVYDIK